MAAARRIPQRELRNDVGAVLREVEAGATLHITVRGRHVADLVPPSGRRPYLDPDAVRRIVREAPLDPGFSADLDEVLGDTIDRL